MQLAGYKRSHIPTITLKAEQFNHVWDWLGSQACSVCCCQCWRYFITILPLPLVAQAGLLLVALCPSGATSNLFSYLAKGDVALSIPLTTSLGLVVPLSYGVLMNIPAFCYLVLNRRTTLHH